MGSSTSTTKVSDATSCSMLTMACKEGNYALLKSLLRQGHSTEVIDSHGRAPIHEAVAHQHVDCVKLLIQQRSNHVKWISNKGETPLLLAARNGDEIIMDVLLSHEADPNLCDKAAESPLYSATMCNSLVCVKLLTKAGANINHQNAAGSSPLHEAVAISSIPIVKFLIENGAKLDVYTNQRISPIFLAAQHGHLDCLQFLLKEAKNAGLHWLKDHANSNGDTPLMAAAQIGNAACLKLLLDNGADPNERNVDNALALHNAVQKGYLECVELLLERSDKCTLFSSDHQLLSAKELCRSSLHGKHSASLLHLAVIYKRPKILKCLLEAGFNANACFEDAEWYFPCDHLLLRLHTGHSCGLRKPRFISALGVAVVMESKEDIDTLLNAGSQIDPDSQEIIAPLTIAAFEGCADIVDLLLSRGADPNYMRVFAPGVCPYPLIAASNDHRTLRILLKAGGDPRLCFPAEEDKCWSAMQVYIKHSHGGWVFYKLTKVLDVYQEFLGHRITTTTLHHIYLELIGIYKFQDATHLWKRIFQISETPHDLAHLCRLKIRESIMDNGINASLPDQINGLPPHLPSQVLQYLKFES